MISYRFGRLAVFGVGAFVVATLLSLVVGISSIPAAVVIMCVALGGALLSLLSSATRPLGVGFFAAWLVTSVFERDFTILWWATVKGLFTGVTAPYQKSAQDRAKLSEWLAMRKGGAPSLGPGSDLVNQVSDCVDRSFPPDSLPATQRDLLTDPACSTYRAWALGERDHRPLYGRNDDGWRWTYETIVGKTRRGGTNYHFVARPDPLLKVPGPIIERDGDGRVLIRDNATAPWQVFSTPIPMMKRFRECVIAANNARPADDKRWPYLPESGDMLRACRDWRLVPASAVSASGDHGYDVNLYPPSVWPRITGHGILYRVLSPGRFEIRSRSGIRRYLLDGDGNLHLTTEDRDAEVSDGPPEPCELDITIACERRGP